MYGNGAGTATQELRRSPGADMPAPVEQISSIHDSTIQTLRDASFSLEQLLVKVRGSQLNKDPQAGIEKVPERHVLADAYQLRALACGIADRVTELQRIIGHEK